MSVHDSINSPGFKTGDYTVTRPGAVTNDGHGRAVHAAPTTFSISASIQPLSDRDLRVLPEALHAEDLRKVYTMTELRGEPQPDVITDTDGAWAVVGRPQRWQGRGGVHYKAIIARQAP